MVELQHRSIRLEDASVAQILTSSVLLPQTHRRQMGGTKYVIGQANTVRSNGGKQIEATPVSSTSKVAFHSSA